MEAKVLSIILPVYQVEKYIEKCIISIEQQDISRDLYEVIVVNDGTKDNSIKLVEDLQKKYSNINIVHKENGGLSSARNFGLKYATGKYIWFIDSDDYIDPCTLKKLVTEATTYDLDLLCFSNKDIFISNKKTVYPKSKKPKEIVSGLEFLKNYELGVVAWAHIAKKELYDKHNIRFTEGIYHEDYEYILTLYKYCSKIKYLDIHPYNYIIKTGGTITTSSNISHIRKRLDSWLHIINSINESYPTTQNKKDYNYYARLWGNTFKYHALSALVLLPLPTHEKKIYIRKFQKINCFPIGKSCLKGRRRFITLLYNNPTIFTFIVYIKNYFDRRKSL